MLCKTRRQKHMVRWLLPKLGATPAELSLALIQDSKNACQVEKEAYAAPEGKSRSLCVAGSVTCTAQL
jgi:hypothetical protein